jgi:hypothetical protein
MKPTLTSAMAVVAKSDAATPVTTLRLKVMFFSQLLMPRLDGIILYPVYSTQLEDSING